MSTIGKTTQKVPNITLDCIFDQFRPDYLSAATDGDLTQILLEYDANWVNPERTRGDMIKKIFEIWAEQEILDKSKNRIICIICGETLKNGNNMTYPCGHSLHSSCMSRYIIINCVEKFSSEINNKEQQIEFDYKCPHCNVPFETYTFSKQDNIKSDE